MTIKEHRYLVIEIDKGFNAFKLEVVNKGYITTRDIARGMLGMYEAKKEENMSIPGMEMLLENWEQVMKLAMDELVVYQYFRAGSDKITDLIIKRV
jgi:hypothetical protein